MSRLFRSPSESARLRSPRIGHLALTLVEMLMALAITAMMGAGLAGLAQAVRMNNDHAHSYGVAMQHARVVLERIERNVNEAGAVSWLPGFRVIPTYVGTWRYPDTLVVWRPRNGPPADRSRPYYRELVLYYPHPDQPNRLLEFRWPAGDTRSVANWAALVGEIQAIKSARQGDELTNLLATRWASDSKNAARRGAVRFESSVPTAVLGGANQAWLRIELQLSVPVAGGAEAADMPPVVCCFGSAVTHYAASRN